MNANLRAPKRIAVCGSASVGKTSLVRALAKTMALPCLEEEMRAFLEETQVRLFHLAPDKVAAILLELWRERSAKERRIAAFVADNCALDFVAYAIHYRCLTEELASALLPEVLKLSAGYDALFVLPWGVLPYIEDGVRTPNRHEQLGYQLTIEGLLRRHIQPAKLHFLPERLTELSARCNWARSILHMNEADEIHREGVVYLVGAGPGDPRLLTLRALELIRKADVIAHDLLVSEAILSLAPANAELLPVGRRYGAEKQQHRLHPEVLDRAKSGKRVVRLKCGDPFIFGRGGEEAEELAEAGIPFEIIPGISAALGAAAYSGIPLTHRCYASHLTLSTGHEAGDSATGALATEIQKKGTTVLYMAARRLPANLSRLIELGYAPDTPAAYIAGATTPSQQVVVATLGNLPEKTVDVNPDIPGLVIVGETVRLREKIRWFEKPELQDCTILVARARPGVSEIAARLRSLGAKVLEAPIVKASPLADKAILREAISRLDEYDVLAFACATGAEFVWPEIQSLDLGQMRIVAIGEQPFHALSRLGAQDVIACSGSCEAALDSIAWFLQEKRVLLITSDQGRPCLLRQLSAIAAKVDIAAAYRVEYDFSALEGSAAFDAIVAPSSSAARLVLSHEPHTLRESVFITMGPASATAARAHGARTVVHPSHDDVESLIRCVIVEIAHKRRAFAVDAAAEEFDLARIAE